MNVTFDPNSIIDLADDRHPHAGYLEQLVAMHNAGGIHLRIVAIGASERRPAGTFAADLDEFRIRTRAAGLEYAEILRPPFYWGITFDEWSIWTCGEMTELERALHALLYPRLDYRWSTCMTRVDGARTAAMYARWRAARVTVLALWSHVRYGGGIYVTRDDLFWQADRRRRLAALGVGEVLTPRQAAHRLAGDLRIV